MFGRIGAMEIAVVLIVALLVFGPKRLPELGKYLGGAIKGFRDQTKEISEGVDEAKGKN